MDGLTKMGFIHKFLPKEDRYAAVMLYGMILATCFNGERRREMPCEVDSHTNASGAGYDAGIMTVILADDQVRVKDAC